VTTVEQDLAKKWRECHVEKQALRREIEDLKGQLAEAERKHQIALTNAYSDGQDAGKADRNQSAKPRIHRQ
jgi:hypothetical protein